MQTTENGKGKVQNESSSDLVNIKVKRSTRDALYSDLKKYRRMGGSRKLELDEIVTLGREAITDDHIKKLCHSTLTNDDKEKLIFKAYKSKNKGATWEQFKGKLLFGELTEFIRKNCQEIICLEAS